ncbi:GAF and ANTAR domain-containing protein [soil metagenome]
MDDNKINNKAMVTLLSRFAGTLVGQFKLDEVVDQLGVDMQEVLDVQGAGVMVGDDDDNLHFITTSAGTLAELERLQLELQEGPCLLAYQTGQHIEVADLSTDPRFPEFGLKAIDAGMCAVYSFPMTIDGQVIGATNLYRDEPGRLTPVQREAGQTLAYVATMYVRNAKDSADRDLMTRGLQDALSNRAHLEQAKGYLMHAHDVKAATAYEMIRSYARPRRIKVRELAEEILRGTVDVADGWGKPS